MAHVGTIIDRQSTTSHGGGGTHNSFGLIALALTAAAAVAGLMLPATGLVLLSTALLITGFGMAIFNWRRSAEVRSGGVRATDVAGLLILLGFVGALIGDTGSLFH